MNPTSHDLRSDDHALAALAAVMAAPPLHGSAPVDEWAVWPIGRRPRLLVPRRPGRASAGLRLAPGARPLGRLGAVAASAALRAGVGAAWPAHLAVSRGSAEAPSLLAWLSRQLGRGPLIAAISLGPPRPSRKPVLQLVDGRGATVGWAKVAIDHHTDLLVSAEARFLAGAGRVDRLRLPEVLLSSSWQGRSILVLGDLGPPSGEEIDVTAELVDAIASLRPRNQEVVLDSGWWTRAGERIGKLTGPDRRLLEDCRRKVGARLGGQRWSFGAWHGDLVSANASPQGRRLALWDWERAGASAPIGFDAVHAIFHRVARPDKPADEALAAVRISTVFGALGYRADQVDPLVHAWLLELRIRLAEDAARGPLGSTEWLAEAVGDALGRQPNPPI